jgi:ceramide glucosyltransferase
MLDDLPWIMAPLAVALWAASSGYVLFALRCLLRRPSRLRTLTERPPVTLLKPLCRLDPGLYENLRSFCEQDYPGYQLVFGLHDADDPARAVAERLIAEFPGRDISLVIDRRRFGCNYKASNLSNMMSAAKHDLLIVSDSDMRVGPDYLAAVVAEFEDPSVGAVTCLYSGRAAGGLASRLGAMFINEWFLPSVLVALSRQDLRFCFGATMAVRRDALDRIGGFAALSAYLADDHMLGRLVDRLGMAVRLCPYVVENVVNESSLADLFRHELRWARTVRTIEPLGYALSFITYLVPMSIIAAAAIELALDLDEWDLTFIASAVAMRLAMHVAAVSLLKVSRPGDFWLVPVRDILSFAVWAASFFSRDVSWKGQDFSVGTDGIISVKGTTE